MSFIQIQVTPDVRISFASEGVFQIEQRFITKTGKNAGEERWSTLGYHGNLKAAATGLFTRHVALLVDYPEKIDSLRSLVRALDKAERKIIEAVQTQNGGLSAPLSYVTAEGVVRIPEDVRKELGLDRGGGVAFVREKNHGHFRMLSDAQFLELVEPRDQGNG